jgi:RNA polymerase sigma factor (sigma-70 family)
MIFSNDRPRSAFVLARARHFFSLLTSFEIHRSLSSTQPRQALGLGYRSPPFLRLLQPGDSTARQWERHDSLKIMTHSTAPIRTYCYAGERQTGGDHLHSTAKTEPMNAETVQTTSAPSQHSDQIGEQAPTNDSYLVAECLKGNEEAWLALVNKYKRLIYSVPIKYGACSEDAADILQSVFMELFSELSKLQKAESLKAWLMVVTSRKCFHWHRQKRLELNLDNIETEYPEAVAISAPEIVEAEKEQLLREGIAQLSPRCRELVRMLFYEQPPLPYAEIAQRVGLATGSIGFTRARCLERLHEILREMGF